MRRNLLLLATIIIIALSGIAFATNDDADPVELVSPEIDQMGQVKRSTALNITLLLKEGVDAVFELVKIEQPDVPFVSEEALDAINAVASRAPTAWLSAGVDVKCDPVPKVDLKRLERIALNQSELRAAYVEQADKVLESYDLYIKKYYDTRREYESDVLMSLVDERQLIESGLTDLHAARYQYEKQSILFFALQNEYNRQFRRSIVSQIAVVQDGPLPYFNYAVSDLMPGKYEIIVRDSKTQHLLINKRRFTLID